MPPWLGHTPASLVEKEAARGRGGAPSPSCPPLILLSVVLTEAPRVGRLCRALATEGLPLAGGLSALKVSKQLPPLLRGTGHT